MNQKKNTSGTHPIASCEDNIWNIEITDFETIERCKQAAKKAPYNGNIPKYVEDLVRLDLDKKEHISMTEQALVNRES